MLCWFNFKAGAFGHGTMPALIQAQLICGQSYKASMLVNYDSRVISISNLLVIITRAVIFERKMFISHQTTRDMLKKLTAVGGLLP